MILEHLHNFFVSIYGKLTGNSYITYIDGYPYYHFSKEQKAHHEEIDAKKEERKRQILSFTLDDMFQFDDIPFLWNKSLLYCNGYAYLPLTEENREVALYYIKQISKLVFDAKKIVPGIEYCSIGKNQIDFNYPIDMSYPVPPCTFLECTPYTPTGKKSKYPVTLHFRTSKIEVLSNNTRFQSYPVVGKIKILCDGQIGSASVFFSQNLTKFSISLYGLSLVIRRIDSEKGNLFRFEKFKEVTL